MALFLALMPAFALAQAPSAVGLKIGDGRLHPFLEVEGRYDSAVGFFNPPNPSPELIFTFRPGLKFDLSNKATSVKLNAAVEYLLFSGLLSPASRNLSRFQANAGLEAAFNRDGAVEFQIGDNFVRSDRTQNPVVGVGVLSYFNQVHAALPIHPGGGALEFAPRVTWAVEFFEPLLTGAVGGCVAGDITCDPSLLNQMNYSNLGFALANRWKFLPKTALILDLGYDLRLYWNPNTQNPQTSLFRAQTGIVGLITPRITLTLLGGVVHDFGVTGATSPSGQVEVSYIPTDLTTLSLGYVRNVMPTPIFGLFADDRGYFTARVGFLGGKLNLVGNASIDYYSFYGSTATGGAGRNDVLLAAGLGPVYTPIPWLTIGAGYNISSRSSSATVQTINFIRHEASLRLAAQY
ncbi:MAG: hypothetical protein JNG84_11880 [Archangium sp.]|nr:hypothetical protein [Archangium sp.]